MLPDVSYPPFLFARDYLCRQGVSPDDITCQLLAGDGSDRKLFRLFYPGDSLILVINEHPPANDKGITENDSFAYIGGHLKSKGFAPPAIHAYQQERGWFILEDLGDVHLQDRALMLKDDPAELEMLYRQVLRLLLALQLKAADGFDTGRIHSAPYDKTFVRRFESDYFLNFFVKGYRGCPVKEEPLAEELEALARRLSEVVASFFLYRDFQSKNIMITRGELRLIDFQGARLGPLHYDLASLLLDPYVDLTEVMREKLFSYYLEQLRQCMPVERDAFLDDYRVIALHRIMQMLGAFAFLYMIKGKSYFAAYMPAAVRNLKNLIQHPCFSPYRELRKVVLHL